MGTGEKRLTNPERVDIINLLKALTERPFSRNATQRAVGWCEAARGRGKQAMAPEPEGSIGRALP